MVDYLTYKHHQSLEQKALSQGALGKLEQGYLSAPQPSPGPASQSTALGSQAQLPPPARTSPSSRLDPGLRDMDLDEMEGEAFDPGGWDDHDAMDGGAEQEEGQTELDAAGERASPGADQQRGADDGAQRDFGDQRGISGSAAPISQRRTVEAAAGAAMVRCHDSDCESDCSCSEESCSEESSEEDEDDEEEELEPLPAADTRGRGIVRSLEELRASSSSRAGGQGRASSSQATQSDPGSAPEARVQPTATRSMESPTSKFYLVVSWLMMSKHLSHHAAHVLLKLWKACVRPWLGQDDAPSSVEAEHRVPSSNEEVPSLLYADSVLKLLGLEPPLARFACCPSPHVMSLMSSADRESVPRAESISTPPPRPTLRVCSTSFSCQRHTSLASSTRRRRSARCASRSFANARSASGKTFRTEARGGLLATIRDNLSTVMRTHSLLHFASMASRLLKDTTLVRTAVPPFN